MADEKCILDPQRDCIGLAKAQMLEKQLERFQEQSRNTHKEMYDRLRDLEKAEVTRNEQYLNIMEKLDELIAWKKGEQEIPKKRWNDIVDKVIWAVVAAVIAFVLARVGL
ncbi:hypothetical protein [uncultured Flavonifractor sp.]|uniref:hypothetical protein n=1 Tax=uncultured Flavonifractor sp. TaxID=1193534 RepID=UPI0026336BDD|nr:hypothetical protein [uncultured Flavonifractor sp.]